jgi:hypothetical protein
MIRYFVNGVPLTDMESNKDIFERR